jgi:hypothetical protein
MPVILYTSAVGIPVAFKATIEALVAASWFGAILVALMKECCCPKLLGIFASFG